MAKVHELTDTQLSAQIEKYEKIHRALTKERDRRAGAGVGAGREEAMGGETKTHQLSLEEDFMSTPPPMDTGQMNSGEKEGEEVGVTRLIRLSKEELKRNKG